MQIQQMLKISPLYTKHYKFLLKFHLNFILIILFLLFELRELKHQKSI